MDAPAGRPAGERADLYAGMAGSQREAGASMTPLTCYTVTRYIRCMSAKPSLLQMSAAARLAWALGACALVWAGVAWAVL